MRARRAVLVLVAALLSASCGARLSDEELATARGGAASATGTGGAQTRAGATTSTTVAVAGGAAPGAAAGAAPAAGGGAAPADPTSAGAAGPQAAQCAPEGASDVGITEDTITLGQVSTISGPVPGLGQTAVNGVRAYFAYRNQQGGVCGRELQLQNADDRLDTGQNRAEHDRMADEVFGFVGGWSVVDDGGAGVLEGTNIPDVGISISDARASLPNNYSTNPIDLQGGSGAVTVLQYMVSTYQPRSAAVVWGAQVTARARAQGFVRDLESLGVTVSVAREVAITETNYVPVAQEIENAGAELVITALELTGISRLAQAFEQVGYLPKVPYYGAQTYGDRFLELAGSAAEGTILGITHPIVEEAASNPQVATFLEWYQRVNPGEEIDFFSFQGWVAADMFADAIEAAGPSPTRDAVLGVLSGYHAFDADGLVAPFDPAGKVNSKCFMIVTVEGGQWRRVHPQGSGFACP
jgi:ABC-type branched-subunit amino acid transport system substrate-binding protein